MSRKHTVNVFRDLPELIYKMLQSVTVMKDRMASEIELMKAATLSPERAHHLMVMAVRNNALPASKLPRVLEFYDNMEIDDFRDRTAWSLFNAFTSVIGQQPPWLQMDNTLRLTNAFREVLAPAK